MKPVDLLPAAQQEYGQSFDWYARQSTIAADPERCVAFTPRHRV
jgi:hypothetical protein